MPARRLLVRKIREVLRLKHERGLSHRAIAQACAIGVGTVSLYLQRTAQRGLGWPLPAELDDAVLEARLFRRAAPAHDRVRPDCAYIHRELKRDGVTLQLLWEEYAQVPSERLSPHPVLRDLPAVGAPAAAIGCGRCTAPARRRSSTSRGSGRPSSTLARARCGASSCSSPCSARAASPTSRRPRPSSCPTGSTPTPAWSSTSGARPPCGSPTSSRAPSPVPAATSLASIAPTRTSPPTTAPSSSPRDRGNQGTRLRSRELYFWPSAGYSPDSAHETFFSLGALNQAIRVLLDELNDRPMKKLGVSRRALYEQLDRPALQPLPATRYVLAQWKLCRLNIDYHVLVERHAYSVPFQLLREQVEIRYTTTTVEVFFKGRRVSSHRRRYDGQPSTVAEHMPSAHRAHAEWTPSRLIRWAEKVGPATGELVARILESRPHPEQGYKAVLGLMRLGRQHGNPRLDAASARAIALGSCRFHTVKNILATGQDRLPLEPPAETAPTPTHANIRGADYYAATNEEDRC